jgi:hypothetical protein
MWIFTNSLTFDRHTEYPKSKESLFLKIEKDKRFFAGCRMTVWIFGTVFLLACFMLKFKSNE